MPFIKYDVKKEIERHKKEDPEYAKHYDSVSKEFYILREEIRIKKLNKSNKE